MSKKVFNRYTVTAALPYTNGPVHIGHLAGVYVPADIYVRYLRAQKRDVIFVCGSDEHGVPITIKAKKENCTPQQLVDKYHQIIGDSMRDLGISFDIYHRTSSLTHHETAKEFFLNLYEKGVFEEEITEQYYDQNAKQFLADRYITGTCPKCGNENAYGDQCEKCGSTLNPTDLINPKSTLSGEPPVLKSTKNWFLPLDKLSSQIEMYISQHQDWKPNVYGQCQSWIKGGLQPRAMTRDLDWGVKVPIKDVDGKVLYVWFDAPIGYISATKDLFNKELSKEKQREYYLAQGIKEGTWEAYWKGEDTKLVHFIGKDNIVFHCIIFPAMLMSHGDFTLADAVPANEFLNLERAKISTSGNWAVWLNEYLQEFEGKQDILRYVLTATAPETKDNDFTWKDFQARNNNELVAILGNFINRVTVLTQKYFDGKVPPTHQLTAEDQLVLEELSKFPSKIAQSIESYRFREALSDVMNLARLGNKYLADTEPWKLIKTDENRVQTILNIGLQITASLRIVLTPFMPFTAQKLADALNLQNADWQEAGKETLLKVGGNIKTPSLLFEKIENEIIDFQIEKLQKTKQGNSQENISFPEIKEEIQYEKFASLDIRVGTIIAAEKIAKTKKLLKLTVDIGVEQRTVVSGIAEYYAPEEIIGQQVSLLANLAPKELKGIVSQGMILMAEDADGQLRFMHPDMPTHNGAFIK